MTDQDSAHELEQQKAKQKSDRLELRLIEERRKRTKERIRYWLSALAIFGGISSWLYAVIIPTFEMKTENIRLEAEIQQRRNVIQQMENDKASQELQSKNRALAEQLESLKAQNTTLLAAQDDLKSELENRKKKIQELAQRERLTDEERTQLKKSAEETQKTIDWLQKARNDAEKSAVQIAYQQVLGYWFGVANEKPKGYSIFVERRDGTLHVTRIIYPFAVDLKSESASKFLAKKFPDKMGFAPSAFQVEEISDFTFANESYSFSVGKSKYRLKLKNRDELEGTEITDGRETPVSFLRRDFYGAKGRAYGPFEAAKKYNLKLKDLLGDE